MARIMAIDYGKKRCGIAVTDTLQISTNGLDTVLTENIFKFLKEYLSQEDVETLVIGEPKRMNDEPSAVEEQIKVFIRGVKKRFPKINVEREDERFTSKMAMQSMVEGGVKKKKRREKELVDKVSATLILQSYLGRTL
ncbi:Holliday junction resolvase RuvX [Salibacter sp.]|uniref:Holliday junction resolvase RuvX n=1 Tax=Salibacter sp. TaxID=2010995 RepID=UPI002870A810|nr:Holliday junction resolvase RuvX [Salibacter sp.]MDR9397910.1 Holliday junction resolvase RuvX [Salibacter sp.]MDR9486568.1 Holliday junction resolvase RuvX [Salibacter sp.]